jgi:hypothetical protein
VNHPVEHRPDQQSSSDHQEKEDTKKRHLIWERPKEEGKEAEISARVREMSDPIPEDDPAPELSILMPCLNEAETLAVCIRKAQGAFERSGIRGEVVIADNGSIRQMAGDRPLSGTTVVPVVAIRC